jgi:hypothetical protein
MGNTFMQKTPMKIVELCIYALIIITAIIWLFAGGKLYNPPERPTSIIKTESPDKTAEAPPVVLPRSEVFPE